MLQINQLCVSTKSGNPLLTDLTLSIQAGELVGICGPSGSGKSLTALSILDYLPSSLHITSGSIKWTGDSATLPRHQRVAAIFQEPMSALNPVMTCGAQLLENVQIAQPHLSESDYKIALESALESVELAAETLEKYAYQLSGGQRQRLVIAMALASKTVLLIADEPTTALDPVLQQEIMELLTKVCKETNTALLFISHDEQLMQRYMQRVIQIEKGGVIKFQEPENEQLTLVVRENLPKAAFKKSIVAAQNIQETTQKPLLEVKNLSLQYMQSGFLRLRQIFSPATLQSITLTLSVGEILVVIGRSGSGKSSLARSLSLPIGKVTGEVRLDGTQCALQTDRVVHPRIQMIWQDAHASLNPRMQIGEMLQEVATQHGKNRAYVHEIVQKIGLSPDMLLRYPNQLSGGQQQRVAIARALVADPLLLICDEITASVDAQTEQDILKMLLDLSGHIGIMFITHQMPILTQIATHVLVLENGRSEYFGAYPSDLMAASDTWRAFLGKKTEV
jgi:peptide/nickel transport system ATP-binding protein